MTQDQTLEKVSQTLVKMFELKPETVTMEATLFEDLDLDSIDAIDMAAEIQKFTGRRLEEEDLRKLRTVGDVVVLIDRMVAEAPESIT
jgi:acyl carrier protein